VRFGFYIIAISTVTSFLPTSIKLDAEIDYYRKLLDGEFTRLSMPNSPATGTKPLLKRSSVGEIEVLMNLQRTIHRTIVCQLVGCRQCLCQGCSPGHRASQRPLLPRGWEVIHWFH
jgi:hypothetical protein